MVSKFKAIRNIKTDTQPFYHIIGHPVLAGTPSLLVENWKILRYFNAYRMAQNKIPHQTIFNIATTSGLMLKILEAV